MRWQTEAREIMSAVADLRARLERLESRIGRGVAEEDLRDLDEAVTRLSQPTRNGQPQATQMNVRFRSYEQAILNIKQLGYELARSTAATSLTRRVDAPVVQAMTSSLCKQRDIESDWLAYWCGQMGMGPLYHRKVWELCYVSQALWMEGMLAEGRKGLAFGVGEEPLPALFACHGCAVLATDLAEDDPSAQPWRETSQHGALERLRRRDICPTEEALARITFQAVDMNRIPADLAGQFDFCWSTCALEHLGSLERGAEFVENSVDTLKSGGVAVHTTEYNLTEHGPTIDDWPTVLFQKSHISSLAERLRARGHEVAPLDFAPGDDVLDGLVDLPPFAANFTSPAHIALLIDGFPCTSIGLIIRKR